jgi:CDP-glucose 4,6-dehydratase
MKLLQLDITKAKAGLGWTPRWHLEETVARTMRWYAAYYEGADPRELRLLCRQQIDEYLTAGANALDRERELP